MLPLAFPDVSIFMYTKDALGVDVLLSYHAQGKYRVATGALANWNRVVFADIAPVAVIFPRTNT